MKTLLTATLLTLLLCAGCTIRYPSALTSGGKSKFVKEIHNNLADGYAVQITDCNGFEARVESGRSVTYVTTYTSVYPYASYSSYGGGYPYYSHGRRVCLLGKVYNPQGQYIGVTQYEIYLSYYGDNDCRPWIINGYDAKASPR